MRFNSLPGVYDCLEVDCNAPASRRGFASRARFTQALELATGKALADLGRVKNIDKYELRLGG